MSRRKRIKYGPGVQPADVDALCGPETPARRPRRPERCPTCASPDPARHPAMQFEGEVEPCIDTWHDIAPQSEEVRAYIERKRWVAMLDPEHIDRDLAEALRTIEDAARHVEHKAIRLRVMMAYVATAGQIDDAAGELAVALNGFERDKTVLAAAVRQRRTP